MMNETKTLFAVATLLVVGFAGCMGGNELDMTITEADDPVNQPFVFEAAGRADRFVWDFGDGTGRHEGRTLEHTFGFTDGRITVRLTAEREGQTPETIERRLVLGTGQNTPPTPVMYANTHWVEPGGLIALDGSNSFDEDGDPLLFAWTCRRAGNLVPHIDDGHEHPTGGVPFGVTVLAILDFNLTAANEPVSGDLCDVLGDDRNYDRETQAVAGAINEPGVYELRMHLRDPKSTSAFVGQVTVFVAPDVPPKAATHTFEGSLSGGFGGCTLQNSIGSVLGDDIDCFHDTFQSILPNINGVIRFEFASSSPNAEVTYEIRQGNTPVVPENADEERTVRANAFRAGPTYDVFVRVQSGIEVDFTLEVDLAHDWNPTHKWEVPLS
jgi:hypothetical protein